MATITFSVELIYEGTGHFMDFEYDWEEFGLSRRELEDLADQLASGSDPSLYNEIMANISIVPTVENVSFDYGDDDESE
jgi:hypothetical protein